MKYIALLALVLLLLLTPACQKAEVCPANSITYVADPALFPALDLPARTSQSPVMVEIGGKTMAVDRVITGPVCNDLWSKTIYVACDIQLVEWKDEPAPTFFENCNLTIEPGTVVYVAAHNNAAYYKGCSCHTGGEPE